MYNLVMYLLVKNFAIFSIDIFGPLRHSAARPNFTSIFITM